MRERSLWDECRLCPGEVHEVDDLKLCRRHGDALEAGFTAAVAAQGVGPAGIAELGRLFMAARGELPRREERTRW